ncbi:MAG: hypothetical protein JSS16_13395 [Proteobacteria bacterium]|nr:hypothetical protein [Pseudomonadota bacterium]
MSVIGSGRRNPLWRTSIVFAHRQRIPCRGFLRRSRAGRPPAAKENLCRGTGRRSTKLGTSTIRSKIMQSNSTNCLTLSALTLAVSMACAPAQGAQTAAPSGPATRSPGTSAPKYAAALAAAQQKLAHAQRVVQGFASRAAAEGLTDAWRIDLLNSLMQSPETSFDQVAAAATARDALAAAGAASAAGQQNLTSDRSGTTAVTPDSLGTDHYDLTYIPIYASCRLVDTRASGGGGPILAATSRKFGVNTAAAQGGTCNAYSAYFGINRNPPAALAINVTVVSMGYSGVDGAYLQVYPDGTTPVSSWMNYNPNEIVANAGILPMTTTNLYFDVFASTETQVVVDVVGAFVAPNPTPLACTQVNNSATNGNGAGFTITSPSCPSGYTVTGGSCYSSPGGLMGDTRLVSSYQNGGAWTCEFYGNTVNNYAGATATCCKVPGGPDTP